MAKRVMLFLVLAANLFVGTAALGAESKSEKWLVNGVLGIERDGETLRIRVRGAEYALDTSGKLSVKDGKVIRDFKNSFPLILLMCYDLNCIIIGKDSPDHVKSKLVVDLAGNLECDDLDSYKKIELASNYIYNIRVEKKFDLFIVRTVSIKEYIRSQIRKKEEDSGVFEQVSQHISELSSFIYLLLFDSHFGHLG